MSFLQQVQESLRSQLFAAATFTEENSGAAFLQVLLSSRITGHRRQRLLHRNLICFRLFVPRKAIQNLVTGSPFFYAPTKISFFSAGRPVLPLLVSRVKGGEEWWELRLRERKLIGKSGTQLRRGVILVRGS